MGSVSVCLLIARARRRARGQSYYNYWCKRRENAQHWVGVASRKMWDIGALKRDGGIGSAFAGYSSKNRDGW